MLQTGKELLKKLLDFNFSPPPLFMVVINISVIRTPFKILITKIINIFCYARNFLLVWL